MTSVDIVQGLKSFQPSRELIVPTAVAALALLIDTVGRWTLTTAFGMSVRPVVLFVIVVSIALGTRARLGLAVGLLLTGALLTDWSGGVTSALAAFVASAVCTQLWNADGETEWYSWYLQYYFAAVSTVVTFASTAAWLSELFWDASFSISVIQALAANLPIVLLAAPFVRVLDRWALGKEWSTATPGLSLRYRILVAATVLSWMIGGYVASFGLRAASLVPTVIVSRRLGSTVDTLLRTMGPQGRYVVVALGAVAIGALLLIRYWADRGSSESSAHG